MLKDLIKHFFTTLSRGRFRIILLLAFTTPILCYGNDDALTRVNGSSLEDLKGYYTQLIEEYKKYAATIKPETQNEIKGYRKKIAELNEQKKEVYDSLSSNAKTFLTESNKFKRRLMLRTRDAQEEEKKLDKERENGATANSDDKNADATNKDKKRH